MMPQSVPFSNHGMCFLWVWNLKAVGQILSIKMAHRCTGTCIDCNSIHVHVYSVIASTRYLYHLERLLWLYMVWLPPPGKYIYTTYKKWCADCNQYIICSIEFAQNAAFLLWITEKPEVIFEFLCYQNSLILFYWHGWMLKLDAVYMSCV